jgi:hypothetical protein
MHPRAAPCAADAEPGPARAACAHSAQITLAEWLGCMITALFANALHAVLRLLLREHAGCLTGDVANGLHVTLAAALTMWSGTW